MERKELNFAFQVDASVEVYLPKESGKEQKADTIEEAKTLQKQMTEMFGGAVMSYAKTSWKYENGESKFEDMYYLKSYSDSAVLNNGFAVFLNELMRLKERFQYDKIPVFINGQLSCI